MGVDPCRYTSRIVKALKGPRLFPFIQPIDIHIDILHLHLRICDFIMRNLFKEVKERTTKAFDVITTEFARIGLSIRFFTRAKSGGKPEIGYTTFNGEQKHKMLSQLQIINLFEAKQWKRAKWLQDMINGWRYVWSLLTHSHRVKAEVVPFYFRLLTIPSLWCSVLCTGNTTSN
jgi:hypothetical protein